MDTTISRRFFLQGALSVAALSVVPSAMADAPRIVGDGIHDDTAGIQALLDGRPFVCDDERIAISDDDHVYLTGGLFRTTRTIYYARRCNVTISRCTFIF